MTVAEPASFRRIVIDLTPGALDQKMIHAAAELARLLRVELLGVFVEDPAILGLTTLPFVRELRLPGHAWHPLEPERVAADLRAAVEQAQALLDRESAALGVTCRFEMRRGDPATIVAASGEMTDILVVAEPVGTIDRLTATIVRAQQLAIASAAANLFLPSASRPGSGPIAVLAVDASDPVLATSADIARSTNRQLLILTSTKTAASLATAYRSISDLVSLGTINVDTLEGALGRYVAPIFIMTRGVAGLADDVPARLAARTGAPVLVMEPAAKPETPRSKSR